MYDCHKELSILLFSPLEVKIYVADERSAVCNLNVLGSDLGSETGNADRFSLDFRSLYSNMLN
jgi:hypothetical protein